MTTTTPQQEKITFADGAINQLSIYQSAKPSTRLLLILPAMGVRASYYQSLAESFGEAGMHSALIDWRGQGHSSIRASRSQNFGYQDYINDLSEVIHKLKEKHTDIYTLGHSLGGQISCLFASKYPKQLKGLILIASCLVHYTGWEGQQPWKIKLAGTLFSPISQLVGYFPGSIIGFGGREGRNTMKDWCHNALTGKYILQNSDTDYEHALAQLSIPTLAFSLEGDTFAPVKAVKQLYGKLGNQSIIEHQHIRAQDANLAHLTHFSWAKENDFFVERICQWIENQA